MRFVLDSNVALRWVLAELHHDKAARLRTEFMRGIHDLLAPDVLAVEVAHALVKAERRGVIQPSETEQLLLDVLSTPPIFHSYLPLLPRALALASAARVGVYDCLYLALAEQEQCDLLTADERLVRAFPTHRVVSLASLP